MPKAKKDIKIPKVTQLPSGSYTTKVMVEGVRITITRDTEEQCTAEAIAIKYGAKKLVKKEKSQKLRDVLAAYIDARRDDASPSTIYGYEGYSRNCFQKYMDTDVTAMDDTKWQAAVNQEKVGKSPKYIANVWGFVASAVEEATGRRPRVRLPKNEAEKRRRPFLEPDQILVLVDALKGKPIEIAALLALSSLRRSELKALKWENVDLEKGYIMVTGAMVYGSEGLVYKEQNKTSASYRAVPIIQPLKDALEAAERKSEFVVTYNGSHIYEQINKICEECGLPIVGIHGLRHSFASLFYSLSIPTKITMEIGGWSDDGVMNRIYTHVARKDVAERAKDFTNFFK